MFYRVYLHLRSLSFRTGVRRRNRLKGTGLVVRFMLNTHGYVSLGPYLCITVVVPANDFRSKKLTEIVATMNHCRSAPLRRSQQSTTLTRQKNNR